MILCPRQYLQLFLPLPTRIAKVCAYLLKRLSAEICDFSDFGNIQCFPYLQYTNRREEAYAQNLKRQSRFPHLVKQNCDLGIFFKEISPEDYDISGLRHTSGTFPLPPNPCQGSGGLYLNRESPVTPKLYLYQNVLEKFMSTKKKSNQSCR